MTQVNIVLMGHAAGLTNPLTGAILKTFPIVKKGFDFRQNLKDYLKRNNLQILNTHALTWNPNE